MSLSNAFRLSFYLSLAMSCVCLFYGEWDFLPWMTALLPIVLALMVLAYRREGRTYLGEQAANRLGTFIGIGTILWIGFKVPHSDQDVLAGGVPWPAALVPLLAPLLPILLLVKLFRPKRVADFWIFQTIGLIIVTLSCILAGEVLFFVLLTLYLVVQLWCLGLFFLYCNMLLEGTADAALERMPLFGRKQLEDRTPVPVQLLRARRVFGFSTVVLAVGLAFFLVLPRFTDAPWVPAKLSSPGRTTSRSGIDPNLSGMDLFREGDVKLSKETAFVLEVHDANGAYANLPPSQRFRVQILDMYEKGRWDCWARHHAPRRHSGAGTGEDHYVNNTPFPEPVPAGMNVGEVFLVFNVTPKQTGGSMPLADPIDTPEHIGLFPIVPDFIPPAQIPFVRMAEQCDTYLTTSAFSKNERKTLKYGQILVPKYQDRGVPALSVQQIYIKHILGQEVPPAVKQWTRALLHKLPDLDEFDHGGNEEAPLPAARHAKIARALSRYLAESGEFTYSLRLQRLGVSMSDPTAEFLLKVKEGHCERYAAGLAIMLRSLGIPSRVVKGYSSAQIVEKGRYLVRQDFAHSWVEALVPGKEPDSRFWLELDPTPSAAGSVDSVLPPFFKWAWTRLINPDFTWKSLVMDYNTDRQAEVGEQFKQLWTSVSNSSAKETTWHDVWLMVRWPVVGLVLLMAAAIGYSCRGRLGWVGGTGKPPEFLLHSWSRLLRLLDRHCQLRPRIGQTPLEFACRARDTITGRLGTATMLADLPVRTAMTLYRQRFSGQTLEPEVDRELEAEITHLELVLRGSVPAVS